MPPFVSSSCPAEASRHRLPCRKTSSCRVGEAEAFPSEPAEARLMSVFRFIGAAYETGDAACWEAAHVRAEETLGTAEAALLVARATAIVRVIRVDKPDFAFLPQPCRRLSGDEAALMRLIRGAQAEVAALRCAAHILDNAGGIRLLASAAGALASHSRASAKPAELGGAGGARILPRHDVSSSAA